MNTKFKRIVALLVAMMMIACVPVFAVAQDESDTQQTVVEPFSLFPLEEVRATIDLSEYLPAQLAGVPIAEVLSKMVRQDTGEPIVLDPAATTVWSNYYDENGEYVYDAWVVAGMEDTINLKPLYNRQNLDLELIVGSGNQLDTGNIRYITKITLPDQSLVYTFDLYEQYEVTFEDAADKAALQSTTITIHKSTVRNPIEGKLSLSSTPKYHQDGTYEWVPERYISIPPRDQQDAKYYINMAVNQEQYPGVDIEVYEGLYPSAQDAITAAEQNNALNITAQISGQTMTEIDAGYPSEWEMLLKELTVVYKKDGVVLGADSFVLRVSPRQNSLLRYLLHHQQGKDRYTVSQYSSSRWISSVNVITYELKAGYSADAEYYFGMNFYDGEADKVDNSKVDKVVVGHYTSLGAAAAQPDIKDQLFVENLYPLNQGYKANYSGKGVDFTVFAGEEHFLLTVIAQETANAKPDTVPDDEAPNVGSDDRYFRADGVQNQDNQRLDTYTVSYEHDTYYSSGYQTLLINDTDADVTALKPEVYLGNNAKVYHNGVLENTEGSYNILSAQDFSAIPQDLTREPKNSVKYTVSPENHMTQKNYWLTIVKKEQGAKLFVNGPDEREIFLNNYYNNVHDIFIANIGTEELTGLTVALDATNVKLDEYWTVGGQGNDTLAPFETTSNNGNWHGELFNAAKIRLVPDGEGEINGTLTIAADGQESRIITLKGVAGNPRIDTTSVHDAVKYVPYQSIITTNNMHDWNKVTFFLDNGKLPSGVTLFPSGELYGVPQETGSFTFRVMAKYSYAQFDTSYATFTLNVLNNTDANVEAQTDEGYEIITRVPSMQTASDQIFEFAYDYAQHKDEFQGFYLDGQKLEQGTDYEVEAGSTKITIKAQTINRAGNGTHTIAAEYRTSSTNQVKKAAQNYTKGSTGGSTGGGTGGSTGGGTGGSTGGGTTAGANYKVSFEVNGGARLDAVTVQQGSAMTTLPTPKREGYAFGGWYADKALTKPFDANTKITAAITLYAKWIELFTLSLDERGGQAVEDIKVQNGQAAGALPTPVRQGYIFMGWYKDEALEQPYDGTETVTAVMTLFAKWREDKPPVDASEFIDVNQNAWFYADVAWAYEKGLMIGYNNRLFAPHDAITGSMVVVVLARLSDVEVSEYENTETADRAQAQWYTPYVKWAKSAGLIENIAFAPEAQMTRAQMGMVLHQYLAYAQADYTVTEEMVEFADAQHIPEQAMDAIQTLFKLQILRGKGNNIIDPMSHTTRAEFAALIHRVDNLLHQ